MTPLESGVLLGFLIFLSAFFSSAETAFTSLSDIRIQHLVEQGRKRFRLVSRLQENRHRLLITILIGNNLVNIAASSLATKIAIDVMGSSGVGIAVGVMTFIILVFGEVTPKTLALAKNEWFAATSAPFLFALQFLLYPIRIFLEVVARLMERPMNPPELPVITEDEIINVVTLGEEAGEVEEDERIMIHNIFRFSDLQAYQIMTDRTAIFSVAADIKVADIAQEIVKRGYSRIPVYEGKRDKIVGVLYSKDVLNAVISGKEECSVKDLARPVLFVPETMLVDDLLRDFQKKRVHMAMVVDEHGGIGGLVTIEDLLEEIVGDIVDETDKEPVMIQKTGKTKALVKGETEIEEVNRVLHLDIKESEEYETISGFVLARLRRIPEPGDELTTGEAVIRISKADRQRIIELEIEKL